MQLPSFNWFDAVALVVLVFGGWRGWRRGFVAELPRLVMWGLIAGLGLLLAGPAADLGARLGLARPTTRLLAYLVVVLVFKWTFTALLRNATENIQQSASAGRFEYQAGIPLGILRYALILLVGLALIAMLPLRGERLSALRHAVLWQSFVGELSEAYWRQVAPESDFPREIPGDAPRILATQQPAPHRGRTISSPMAALP